MEAEKRNLGHYGFGVKGFVLSMIETAIEVTEERVPARVISELIACGQEMLQHPIELLPHAREAIACCARDYQVALITKGDLLDQERKLAQSGLGEMFNVVEIVSDKNASVYAEIFARVGHGADRAMMVGDSMKSDVLPVISAGGWGVHVPHGQPWALEQADAPMQSDRFHEIESLAALPDLINKLN